MNQRAYAPVTLVALIVLFIVATATVVSLSVVQQDLRDKSHTSASGALQVARSSVVLVKATAQSNDQPENLTLTLQAVSPINIEKFVVMLNTEHYSTSYTYGEELTTDTARGTYTLEYVHTEPSHQDGFIMPEEVIELRLITVEPLRRRESVSVQFVTTEYAPVLATLQMPAVLADTVVAIYR